MHRVTHECRGVIHSADFHDLDEDAVALWRQSIEDNIDPKKRMTPHEAMSLAQAAREPQAVTATTRSTRKR